MNRYQQLIDSYREKDKGGWIDPALTGLGAILGSVFLPGVGTVAGASLGSSMGHAAGSVGHSLANGQVDPMQIGKAALSIGSGYNAGQVPSTPVTPMGSYAAQPQMPDPFQSILDQYRQNPQAFACGGMVQRRADGGPIYGPQPEPQADPFASLTPEVLDMLQKHVASLAGAAPVAPTPAVSGHPTLEMLANVLPQVAAALPRPAVAKNTKAIGAWLPAATVAASAPFQYAQGKREKANAQAQAGYEDQQKAYEDRKTKLMGILAGNATKRFGNTSSSDNEPMDEETALMVTGSREWAGKTRKDWNAYLAGVRAKKGPVSKGPTQAPSDFTPAGLELAARQYVETGQMPPLGMQSAGLRTKIINRAAEIDARLGGQGIASGLANFRANSKSLSGMQTMVDVVSAFSRTADRNSGVLLRAMKAIPDTGSPFLNQPIRALAGKVGGSAEVAAYNTALRVVVPEFAKILSNPNLTGVLSDEARHDMQRAIDGEATIPQMIQVLATLRQDAANRKLEYEAQLKEIRGRIGSGGGVKWPASSLQQTPAGAGEGR